MSALGGWLRQPEMLVTFLAGVLTGIVLIIGSAVLLILRADDPDR